VDEEEIERIKKLNPKFIIR